MNKLIQRMLENRGYPYDFLDDINRCDHVLPSNIDLLCERLHRYRLSGERVIMLSDFDTDGIMSGVIGFSGLAEMGFNVALYLPTTDSYGFSEDDVVRILSQYSDAKVILTADVGISAHKGVEYAQRCGLEVLVTDHHKTSDVVQGNVVVDPACDVNKDVYPSICGAHVLYLVLLSYAKRYAPLFVSQIERLSVFAGIATVADSMPVYYENRPIIRQAVSFCRSLYADGDISVVASLPGCAIYRRCFFGLFKLIEVFSRHGKLRDSASLTETFFGFYVAPALNSIKRMSGDITDAYMVFFGDEGSAVVSLEKILSLTDQRKLLVEEGFQEIVSDLSSQPWAPYIYVTTAPAGLRGLLAQRFLSMTGLPVLVVAETDDGSYIGSGRCPSWFPFLDIVGSLDFVHPAGHNVAFGVKLDGSLACDDMFSFLKAEVDHRKPADFGKPSKPDFVISTVDPDADCGLDEDLFYDYLSEIEAYRPFGVGFQEPQADLEFDPRQAVWSYLGSKHSHVKAMLPGGFSVLLFNQASLFPDGIDPSVMPSFVKVRGRISINEFRGRKFLQFIGELHSFEKEAVLC